ncbi:MAG: iron ABC transporter permease, partial [Thermodesulfobacteriota bacterium]
MKEKRIIDAKRHYLLFALFSAVLPVSAAVNIIAGSIDISLPDLLRIISSHDVGTTSGFIVWNIRIPRAVATVMGGAYLAVAGLLLQVFFRNPIVGPFILGISSGATLT